jgi:urease alpha subunit
MAHHGRIGRVEVEPDAARVTLDGEAIAARPLDRVALSRLYLI